MDFRLPPELLYSVGVSLAFPVTLFVVTRWPGHNARRFLVAALLHTVIGATGELWLPGGPRPATATGWLLGALVWTALLQLYLQVWSLLSRGYTLSMLIVLLQVRESLDATEIARRYRGGAGLGWIMQHRTRGLEAAGMVEARADGALALTGAGSFIARAYLAARGVFGLRDGT